MAESNILIKITSETQLDEAQKQLQTLTKRAEDLEIEMSQMQTAYENEVAAIKKQNKSREEQAAELLKLKQRYRDIKSERKAEATETKKSIKELENQIKSYKTLQGTTGKAVQQLRAMREALMQMEDAGEFGSQAFIDLSIAAGQLEDKIGDTQARIRVLASDTKEVDAVMGLGDGLAGSFYVATSAAELLGGDIEGLQAAFYKVQNAMSVVSGVQQVWNALNKDSAAMVVLNTALQKLFNKSKEESAAATAIDTAATTADTTAKGAEAVATGVATKAQWSLNAAFAANPIGVVIAAVLAAIAVFAAFGIGIAKLVHHFSAAGQAERDYAKASKELEKIQAENAVGAAKRSYDRQQQVKATTDAEQQALDEAKKRNASEIEMAQIRAKYAKQSADDTQRYADDEIKRNTKEVDKLREMMEAKQREVNAYRDGSKKKKKAQEELNEVEQQYYDALQKSTDLENERNDALREAAQAEQELLEARRQMRLDAEQANIDLMKEGQAKELAQIRLNYREQLKQYQGNSAEEVKMRNALLAKQAKEIEKVRKKYAQEEVQVYLQEQKNALEQMSQESGTEAMYEAELAFRKQILQQEADAQISALDKENMTAEAYAAQREAIELQLARDIKQIDDDEVVRKAENAKRLTDIALIEAEAEKNALNGSEGVEKQKQVWENYYAVRRQQLNDNAQAEINAIKRSTDTEEVKTAKIKAINAQLNADLTDLKKEQAQTDADIDSQYLDELQRKVTETEDAVSRAQLGGKLPALQANLQAQTELYNAQLKDNEARYKAGLITYQEYKQQEFEITKTIADAEVQYQTDSMQAIADGFQTALDYMQQVSDLAFEAINNNIQAQLDALDEEYTTDAEEAKKNANKKYISEAEYEKKKAALEMKQAKYAKAQALTNIGIQTALSIITTLAQLGATPWGIAAAAIAGTMGAAQLAVAAAKPLAQYEKGRRGGKGEYALVGEKGAEIMYIPQGASIIPHDKIGNQEEWANYGVPKLSVPQMPAVDSELTQYITTTTDQRLTIDYDKLGEAVARNIPKQQAVTVNVDRSGVHVNDGFGTHTHLNTKYNGVWR